MVSRGARMTLNAAAHSEAKAVLIANGSFFMNELDSTRARTPAFAAVSPKRATGPWIRATERP